MFANEFILINANCEDIYTMFYDTGCHIWLNTEIFSSINAAIKAVRPNATILLINEGYVYFPVVEDSLVTGLGMEIECTCTKLEPINIFEIPKSTKINMYDTCAKYMLKCVIVKNEIETNTIWYYLDSIYDYDYIHRTEYNQEIMITDEFGTPRVANEPEKLDINLKFKEVLYNVLR